MDWSVILAQLGPSAAFLGLLLWLGRLYYTGKLVPRSTVVDMQQNFAQQIAREREISDNWRSVAANNTEALRKLSYQTERLIEGQKTVEAFILSLTHVQPKIELTMGPGGSQ